MRSRKAPDRPLWPPRELDALENRRLLSGLFRVSPLPLLSLVSATGLDALAPATACVERSPRIPPLRIFAPWACRSVAAFAGKTIRNSNYRSFISTDAELAIV